MADRTRRQRERESVVGRNAVECGDEAWKYEDRRGISGGGSEGGGTGGGGEDSGALEFRPTGARGRGNVARGGQGRRFDRCKKRRKDERSDGKSLRVVSSNVDAATGMVGGA